MNNFIDNDSRSPPPSGSVVTRAPNNTENNTAQPPLTSGFGAVIEKERDLQLATESSFGVVSGPHSAEVERILHHQHSLIGMNIALLEQRYEALPKPERFVSWKDRARPPAQRPYTLQAEAELLPELVAQHTRLLADIDALIGCAPDGQRGELILSQVARSHEEMAWMLTALLKEEESATRTADRGTQGPGGTGVAQQNWDNEGGPVRVTRPSN